MKNYCTICKVCFFSCKQYNEEILKGHLEDLVSFPAEFCAFYPDFTIIKHIFSDKRIQIFHGTASSNPKNFLLKIIRINSNRCNTLRENLLSIKRQNENEIFKLDHDNFLHQAHINTFEDFENNSLLILFEPIESALNEIIINNNLSFQMKKHFIKQIAEALLYLHDKKKIIYQNLSIHKVFVQIDKKIKLDSLLSIQPNKFLKNVEDFSFHDFCQLAPEEFIVDYEITPKIDSWKLGILIHQIMSGGHHPFHYGERNISKQEIKHLIEKEKYQIHSCIKEKYIQEIIEGCLRIDPGKRLKISEILNKLENPDFKFEALEVQKKPNIHKINKDEEKNKLKIEELSEWTKENFLIGSKIGAGSFCSVYKAFDKQRKKDCAIKFIRTLNEEELEDFNYQMKINQQLTKSNNPFFLPEKWFIFPIQNQYEYRVQSELGIDLEKILKIKQNLEEKEIFFILNKMVEGLALAKQQGIYHGDIKPTNIVLVKDEISQTFIPKLIDYSFAGQITDLKNEDVSIDELKGFSMQYSAPEIFKISIEKYDKEVYNPFKADIFSLAKSMQDLTGLKSLNFLDCIYPKLSKFLHKMLDADSNTRISYDNLLETLKEIDIRPLETREIELISEFFIEKEKKISQEPNN